MVRTMVPPSFGVKGFGVNLRFPFIYESNIESTSVIAFEPPGCLPGFPLSPEGLVQPKELETLF